MNADYSVQLNTYGFSIVAQNYVSTNALNKWAQALHNQPARSTRHIENNSSRSKNEFETSRAQRMTDDS